MRLTTLMCLVRDLGLLRQALVAAALTLCAVQAGADTPPWPAVHYTYFADNKPLSAVLNDFASSFSLSIYMPRSLDARVNGRFDEATPTAFLDRITGVYGLQWFTHAGTLYVSRTSDATVRMIPMAGTGGQNLTKLLQDLGVLDSRFGWGELPQQHVVAVSGPPAYVQLVASTVASLPQTHEGVVMEVFRLRHASVVDRRITYRDQQVTTPGVARILRDLVMGGGSATIQTRTRSLPNSFAAAPALVSNPAQAMGLLDGAGGTQSGGQTGAGAGAGSTAPSGTPRTAGGEGGAERVVSTVPPTIEADPRTNSILVRDVPDRMPMYARLIAELDVAAPLVEIEAMIIDVNTSHLKDLGIAWNAVMGNQGAAVGYGNVSSSLDTNTLSVILAGAGSGVNPGTILPNSAAYFLAHLQLLEQQGYASIEGRPSVLATDNVGAVIDLSKTFYIQTTSQNTALVTPVTAGTTLNVTPRVIGQGDRQLVHLTVDIDDGQIQTQTTVGNLPTVDDATLSTEADVRKGESLLIGGYNTMQTSTSRSKVPGLGDLPIIGAMFSNSTAQTQKTTRLFLIRTKVVDPENLHAGESGLLAVPAMPTSDPLVLLPDPMEPRPATAPPASTRVQNNARAAS